MSSAFEKLAGRSELSVIVTDNPYSTSECILHPADATDQELKTMWIRAVENGYTALGNMR